LVSEAGALHVDFEGLAAAMAEGGGLGVDGGAAGVADGEQAGAEEGIAAGAAVGGEEGGDEVVCSAA